MAKITPHLWFPGNGAEAARFYTSLIPGSHFDSPRVLENTPSGTVELFAVRLAELDFQFLSADSNFRFTPAVSFRLDCDTVAEVDRIVGALSEQGSFLMPLGSYPFSGRYAWVIDRFGVSWQIMLNDVHKGTSKITPTLMFVGPHCGHAEEAVQRYTSLFPRSSLGGIDRYDDPQGADKPGTVRQAVFQLAGVPLAAMDSAHQHDFTFTEAISFLVQTEDQSETDFLWEALSADSSAEACGWLKDRWGVSWQIVPKVLGQLMSTGSPEQRSRVTQAFLKMKKLDIALLEDAANS